MPVPGMHETVAEIKSWSLDYVVTYPAEMITARARALLDFETANPERSVSKLEKIRGLGLTPDGYEARLGQLVADVDVMAEYPELVYRYWNQRRAQASRR
ncbi:hypothetical protein C5E07_05750 [Pseudoclavibacter sp. RFBJ3]|nr:hypothetical protein C5C12_06455 [Pseudoclavibacter sp. RFBJ5]PPF93998.1 hypothetical protein C5E07_05750 [Pseudoclavibacter sp. RFBJ3]PPF98715.1 hypothetical protein C5C19_08735 [Pseudoclavibacter sp. RFBH5]PPG24324.1 hypothetical protein C5E13_06135 [Pseudoclavibacter sp. RFBI4]